MQLDKRTLFSLLLADLFVITGAFFVIKDRYDLANHQLPEIPQTSAAKIMTEAEKAAQQKPEKKTPPPPKKEAATFSQKITEHRAVPSKDRRNILFSYRNSRPKRVELISSFNDWTPKAMKPGKNHTWEIAVKLPPGDYTYNYVVDGRVIRDPNNPRTAPGGRSLLTVKPLPPS